MVGLDRKATAICIVVVPTDETGRIGPLLKAFGAAPGLAIIVLDRATARRDALTRDDIKALTALPVVHGESGKAPKANQIVLIGPDQQLDFTGGKLALGAMTAAQSSRRGSILTQDIDALSRQFGSAAAGVALAADDTEALLALEPLTASSGLALLVDDGADDATAAQSRGIVDVAGPPETVAAAVIEWAGQAGRGPKHPITLSSAELRELCDIIHTATGHDFRHYKEATLSRRIQRRIGVLHCTTFADYRAILKSEPDEVQTLMRDLLIGVTSFFRDTEVFAALRTSVLDTLITAEGTEPLRIWIPACATGQEAYSVAILAREVAEACGSAQTIQIFATDLNERALATARRGVYPATIADEVGADRLARFFNRNGRQWQISRQIRQMVAFSPQNLISDPPLSGMHLICCRNLLIYLGSHLQKKLMSVFHYSLRPRGFLLLGSSEAVTGHGDIFRAIDARHRIAQRIEIAAPRRIGAGDASGPLLTGWQPLTVPDSVDLGAIVQRIVLDEFAPPYAIANEDAQITYLSPGADRFLQPPAGHFVNSILRLSRPGLRSALRTAWTRASANRRTETRTVQLLESDRREMLRLTVQPMPELGQGEGSYMVVFQSIPLAGGQIDTTAAPRPDAEPVIEQLEAELHRTRDELERVVQDFEAANEELKSSNEELLSMNEELQASNEELEASKEEIQISAFATDRANADLLNLLASTEIATIFLDATGAIRSFTPIATRLYNISDTDIGRPLSHFTDNFRNQPPLPDPARPDPDPTHCEAIHNDGRVFLRRVTPYRINSRTDGAVITYVDISEQTRVARQLAESLTDIETIFRNAPIGLAQFAPDMTYLRINDMLAAINGIPAADHIGKRVAEVLPDIGASIEALLDDVLRTGQTIGPREVRGTTPATGDREHVWLATWAPVLDAEGKVSSVMVSAMDVTDRERQAAELRDSADRLRKTMDQVLAFVGVLSPEGVLLEANEPAIAAAGVSRDEVIGKPFWDCFWWTHSAPNQQRLRNAVAMAARGEVVRYDVDVQVAGGGTIDIDFQLAPYFDDNGAVIYLIPSGVDISERVSAVTRQHDTLRSLELALDSGQLGIFDWDLTTGKFHWSDHLFTICGYEVDSVTPTYERWRERAHPDDLDRVEAELEAARTSGRKFASTYRMLHPDGRVVEVDASGSYFYADGGAVRMIGVLRDVSALKTSELRLREMMATSQIGIALSRRDGSIFDLNGAARDLLGAPANGPDTTLNWRGIVDPDNIGVARRIAARLFRQGRVGPVDVVLRGRDGVSRPCLISAAQVGASTNEYVTFIVDQTAQKKADSHREMLVEELNHRVKNTLATIQAMATHTLRGSPEPKAFQEAFIGRLHAIAVAHEILTKTDGGQVGLVDLIRRQIGPYVAMDRDQLVLDGDDMTLAPNLAHALGLVLHELTTNAAKYGALSTVAGRIEIAWREVHDGCPPHVRLTWREVGGPPVVPPTQTGFGSRLIETSLSHALDGRARISYDLAGLHAVLLIPKGDVG